MSAIHILFFYIRYTFEGRERRWISRCKALLKPNRNDDKVDSCCFSRNGVKAVRRKSGPET